MILEEENMRGQENYHILRKKDNKILGVAITRKGAIDIYNFLKYRGFNCYIQEFEKF